MILFLSKLLPLFVYPFGFAIILLIFGLLFKKKPKLLALCAFLALLILFVGGNPLLARFLAKSLEWQNLPTPGDLPRADAIVILGGGTESKAYPRPIVELNAAGDRVMYGAHLFKDGKAPWILLGGGAITWQKQHSTTPAEEMGEVIKEFGITEKDYVLQSRSLNTYEEAVFDAEILRERGATRIILVTSAMHMPRALALFRKQGLEVIPAPTDFKVTENNASLNPEDEWQAIVFDFLPDSGSLSLTSVALKEYLGWMVYRLRGWI
jgi:uncharacterized SAM-binding protein YcdF (DUF218 family)